MQHAKWTARDKQFFYITISAWRETLFCKKKTKKTTTTTKNVTAAKNMKKKPKNKIKKK